MTIAKWRKHILYAWQTMWATTQGVMYARHGLWNGWLKTVSCHRQIPHTTATSASKCFTITPRERKSETSKLIFIPTRPTWMILRWTAQILSWLLMYQLAWTDGSIEIPVHNPVWAKGAKETHSAFSQAALKINVAERAKLVGCLSKRERCAINTDRLLLPLFGYSYVRFPTILCK